MPLSLASSIRTGPKPAGSAARSLSKSSGCEVAMKVTPPTRRHGRTACFRQKPAPSWSISRASAKRHMRRYHSSSEGRGSSFSSIATAPMASVTGHQ